MNTSVTQNHQSDKDLSQSIHRFFKRFRIASVLKSANAYKKKGIAANQIFQYLFTLVFINRSMYMNIITGKQAQSFAKDTVYRFLKMSHINWLRFTTNLSTRIIRDAIEPLTSEERKNVLIVDDSAFERNRSKKVELLTKAYDHAKKQFFLGFRMLTLGWSDGNTFLPVNSILLSSEKKKSRINEAVEMDKRTNGFKRRSLSKTKATEAMIVLIKEAKRAMLPASYVLFDSWFTSPKVIQEVKKIGYHVIAMVKKTPKMYFEYHGENISLPEVYKRSKKRRGRSRYLLSVDVNVVRDDVIVPAKVVFVRNKNNRKDYLILISTDLSIDEDEIIRLYGKRWDIEVFFKVCKSYLKLRKECNSLSFDAVTAHTAIVFARYMLLSLGARESTDDRSLGGIFLYFSDEQSDITWIQAFQLLVKMLRDLANDYAEIPETVISDLLDVFFSKIPLPLANALK